MMFGHQKRLNFGPDLSGQIHSAFLRRTIVVVFEKDDVSFDSLTEWCDSHCEDVYSANKSTSNSANFRFFKKRDFAAFQQMLQQFIETPSES